MASNAFTDAKQSWAGREEAVKQITDDLLAELGDAYKGVNDSLYAEITRLRARKFYSASEQQKTLGRVRNELRKFGDKFSGFLKDALERVGEIAVRAGFKDVTAAKAARKRLLDHLDISEKLVETAISDQFIYIAAQTNRMHATVKKLLQQEAAMVFRLATVEGISRDKAAEMLRESIMEKEPGFEFIDKAGRRWDSKVYFDMLAKTALSNLEREAYVSALINEKHDLAQITSPGSRDACRGWEGKVLSLTGSTPGYPTLESAIGSGEIFHPRCRHSLVVYHEE